MNKSVFSHRVIYADTDHFGVVYYARYLEWMEAGRSELLRKGGISYADYEKMGFFVPVVKLDIEYQSPARYDDIVDVETRIEKIGNSSIHFTYDIKVKDKIIATAKTVNVFITRDGKKVNVPDEVRNILK
ncbi:acyl-CoA thioesterase [Candidatus Woesearchaeota archaeon]|nr:acyl-CoA thioesterase [Candidatus Woesearchaeota archaeon]